MKNLTFKVEKEVRATKIVDFAEKGIIVESMTEQAFKECIVRGEVSTLTVVNNGDEYSLLIEMNYRSGAWSLFNTRKELRAWRSVDSLITYLKKVGFSDDINFKIQKDQINEKNRN
jgi:hypothetical protein